MSKGTTNMLRGIRTAATVVANLQGLIGLALLAVSVGILWRPAGAALVIGGLLVLDEVCAAVRGTRVD